MHGSRLTTSLAVVAILAATGCTSLPRLPFPRRESSPSAIERQQVADDRAEPERGLESATPELPPGDGSGKMDRLASASTDGDSTTSPATVASPAKGPSPTTAPSTTTGRPSDSDELKQFITELDAYPEIDPAKRTEMVRLLMDAEPWLQGKLIRQHRASLAYARQQTQRRAPRSAPEADKPSMTQAMAPTMTPPRTPVEAAPEPSTSVDGNHPPSTAAGLTEVSAARQADLAAALIAAIHETTGAASGHVERLPAVVPAPQVDLPAERRFEGNVVAASHQAELPVDWQARLKEAIDGLESSVNSSGQSPEEVAQHVRLRLLYLAAGRRDDAMRPIPSLEPPLSDFWSEEFFGLGTLVDTTLIADAANRAAEAKGHLSEAVDRLGESAPLVVRNLSFITDVQSYGVYQPFDKYEFRPNQRLLLYAEVENYESRENSRGYHTGLKSSYQIFDSRGRRVADHEFPANEEHCRNRRRDFFIGYEFTLPDKIYSGKHTLQLTVADLNSEKVGQSMIEFHVKTPDE